MRSFRINDKNDLVLDSLGNLAVVDGLAAIQQNCVTVMQAQLGEMVYAIDKGIPTLQTIWDRYDPGQFEAAARAAIRSVEGVVGVEEFAAEQVGDVLTYTAKIQTTFGRVAVTGAL